MCQLYRRYLPARRASDVLLFFADAEDAVVGAAHMRDEDRDYSMFFHLVASPDSEIFSSMTEPISVRGNCSKYIISRPLLAIKSFMRS